MIGIITRMDLSRPRKTSGKFHSLIIVCGEKYSLRDLAIGLFVHNVNILIVQFVNYYISSSGVDNLPKALQCPKQKLEISELHCAVLKKCFRESLASSLLIFLHISNYSSNFQFLLLERLT